MYKDNVENDVLWFIIQVNTNCGIILWFKLQIGIYYVLLAVKG